ncbi:MAG: hypothetical protein NT016_04210 [Candidatus Aenigmarchaeota archaeon]|nr:hypothetical protein [Candidatus Aenigmarchaeota archaeon]
MVFGKRLIVLIAVLVVAIILAALFLTGMIPTTGAAVALTNIFGPSKETIAANVKNLYELANPGVTTSVVTTTEQDGMYKIVLKLDSQSGTSYNEVFVTKDGEMMADSSNMVPVQQYVSSITNYRNFVSCLYGKGVRIAGLTNQTATDTQLNLLGRYSPALFVDCGTNLNACISANVTQVPSVVIGQYVIPGVQSVDWFTQVTGCKLG